MAGQIFVVSGASGSGKTSLVRALQESDAKLGFSVSYTTRKPRSGEVHGEDYFFVKLDEFQQLIQDGLLIEYVKQFGNYYGTSRPWIEEALKGGQDLLFDVEIHGAKALKNHFPQGKYIFILPPSLTELERRLRQRGSLPETELRQRLARVRQEVKQITWYDYLIINDDFNEAVLQLQAVIIAARSETSQVWPAIRHAWD
ncbi:guanylate kinase [Desulfobacca acetoxidans]|uniref:Guanylate kinase n=1 Tax=Desulfobacca acetoxidans (strain ATCC 700848 / DSM 11109 / ASRB2) TaxID=880072 RepID=F2NGU8_DESAR|nr:guanylate kinase [Desulfobacca acetoxidans]AEB08719.1 Guanylate kinase [Desulfobacca acetoxidans DSM 11109]